MIDLRKIVIIFVIAVLFAIFVHTFIQAVYPAPDWNDYCSSAVKPRATPVRENCSVFNVPEEQYASCGNQGGYIEFLYDSEGCASGYTCNTCNVGYDEASRKQGQVAFYLSALLSLIAIVVGLFLPVSKHPLNEWIGTGLMLGGLFSLFFGTARYFSDLSRILRPVIMLVELAIVIFVAYRKLDQNKPKKK